MARHRWLNPGWLVFFTLMALLILAVACGETAVPTQEVTGVTPAPAQEDPTPTAQAATPTSTPLVVPKGQTFEFPLSPAWVSNGKFQNVVLQLVASINPGQWDVQACAGLPSCLVPSSPRFNGLIEYDPVNPGEIIGDLAQSWEVNPSGTVYTFNIRDANWSDGQPVTAEDIVFSLDRIVLPDAIRGRTSILRTFYEHGTAQALDEKTVEVPLKYPAKNFLLNLGTDYMKMYPKHVVENLAPDDAHQAGGLIGSGPWKLKDFSPQSSYELERNPDYFKPDRPFMDGLKFNIIRDTSRQVAALQLGQVHTTYFISATFQPDILFELEKDTDGKMRPFILPKQSMTYLTLHMNKPPFDDERVRRAVFLAVDREEIFEITLCTEKYGCYGGQGTFFPGELVEPPEELAQVPGWRQPKDQDIAEAKELLAAAGYSDGIKADLNTSSSASGVQLMELVSEQLRTSINVDLKINPVDRATSVQRMLKGEMHVSNDTSAVIIPDPEDYLNQHFLARGTQKNPDSWSDPRLDGLMDAQGKELDPQKRLALFKEMAEILREGTSQQVPLRWNPVGTAVDYRIQNFVLPPSNQLARKWEHLWWDPDAPAP